MSEKAVLTVGDQRYELPMLEGTEGERAIDITRLRDDTGLLTYDPSLGNTAVCRSAITFIDGDKGILRYRGIPIEQFASRPNFVEVAWMLIFGRLPRQEELKRFSELLTANELLHEGVGHQFQHIPPRTADGHSLSHVEQPGLLPPNLPGDRRRGIVGRGRGTADQQGADHRGLFLSPRVGPAVQLPRSAAALLRQLPAHDVLHSLPAIHRDAGSGRCAEPGVHFARRPRTELQHVDGAGGGVG